MQGGILTLIFSFGARLAAICLGILIAGLGGGCAGSDPIQTAALAAAPIAPGKARVSITRTSAVLYAAAPATITLNDQKVASVGNGETAIVDIPAGANTLAASAWSYPGEYKVKLNAFAGQTYKLEVAPRGDSFGPSVLLGPIGGMIDSAANENAGAFELRLAGEPKVAAAGQ